MLACEQIDLITEYVESNSFDPVWPFKPAMSYTQENIKKGLVTNGVIPDSSGVKETCTIEGVTFPKCYGMIPNSTSTDRNPLGLSRLWFNIGDNYPYTGCQAQFKAVIGLQDDVSCNDKGQVTFYVKGAGVLVGKFVRSRISKPGTFPGAEYIEVDLPVDTKRLELEIDYSDKSGNQCDYAIWAEPRVTFCGCSTAAPSCPTCPAGKYEYTSCKCKNCEKGKFNALADQTQCTACTKCAKGKYQSTPCGFNNPGVCTDCPKGKYQNRVGKDVCKVCPASQYQDTVGQTSCKQCATCPKAQYYNLRCSKEAQTACSNCPTGKYNTEPGAFACLQCPVCPQGLYAINTCAGSTPLQCRPCDKCAPGKYFTNHCAGTLNNKSPTCENCPSGKYTSVEGKRECNLCAVGKQQPTAGSPSCQTCPAGKFTTSTGTPSCQTCKACEPGKYIAQDCKPTADRVCLPCSLSFNYQGSSNKESCTKCSTCTLKQSVLTKCSLTANTVCIACNAGCLTCTPDKKCKLCDIGYGLQPDGSCSECSKETPPAYYEYGDVACRACKCLLDGIDGYKGTTFCRCYNDKSTATFHSG